MLKWSVLKLTQNWTCNTENTQALCGSSEAPACLQELELE